MSHSNPTQNEPADNGAESPRRAFDAGQNAANLAPGAHPGTTPLRGEIFDVMLDQNGEVGSMEAAPEKGARHFKGAVRFLCFVAGMFFVFNAGAYVNQKSKAPAPIGPFATKNEVVPAMRIQVAGLVKKPGVYTLKSGARIEDAIKQAGGAQSGADLNGLNLADWVVDGSKIEVPAKTSTKTPTPTPVVVIKEVFVTPPQNAPETTTDTTTETAPETLRSQQTPRSSMETRQSVTRPRAQQSTQIASAGSRVGAVRTQTESPSKSSQAALDVLRQSPIDLNRASAEQLAALPGVGPKMAERILQFRKENGGFKSVDDLDNVRGIGEKRMETLRSLVRVK
ncbi:comEA protein [Abditibacterium utsteinense]|uniref:ComEA protein n=1 Tax=Abditibacterium utsteinense TaxID=1960156 RepID=A0A2S8SPN4_9BACT|nr:helix-hairpin-helix domain-containing protein [Abditibacterium utsteinense]PQV62760.1 comEA protein [Abditibacterium utsteinense]